MLQGKAESLIIVAMLVRNKENSRKLRKCLDYQPENKENPDSDAWLNILRMILLRMILVELLTVI